MATRGEPTSERRLFSLDLPPEPGSVSTVRRRLREVLTDLERDDLTDDATLVVSELVTNAMLHAGSHITVAASADHRRLLVQVGDTSIHVPSQRRYGDEARTGRGLLLVESMCHGWGVVRHPLGKTVWVQWRLTDTDESTPVPQMPDGSTGPEALASDTQDVVLLELPLLLHAAWREQAQAMLRDYLLATLGDGDGDDEARAVQVHAEVTDVIAVLDEQLPRPAIPMDSDTVLGQEAVEPAVTLTRSVVRVPIRSVAHFATLDRASEAALAMTREGRLLTPPSLPEVRTFRRWLCAQVRDQAAGLAPAPFSFPVDDRQRSSEADGWDGRGVCEATSGRVASDIRGRIVAVNPAALTLLGYDDPDELIGRRLVVIIPERLRQAHVAGMTMYLLTGRRPMLDTTAVVPAQRRDGSEVLVDLIIHEEPTATDRPVLVAEIRPVGNPPPSHPLWPPLS